VSYYDDYIADGCCCECCGAYLDGGEQGFARRCDGCKEPPRSPKSTKAKIATALAKDKVAGSRGGAA
jgi:hypothetical protein